MLDCEGGRMVMGTALVSGQHRIGFVSTSRHRSKLILASRPHGTHTVDGLRDVGTEALGTVSIFKYTYLKTSHNSIQSRKNQPYSPPQHQPQDI